MGAWGHRSFENDSALDWFGDLEDGDASLVGEILDAVGGAGADDYLEVDEASAALAAAELMAAALGKGDDRLDESAAAWLAGHRDAVRAIGAVRARRAVERVFANSELRELWDENGDDTAWHVDVRALIARLA